MKLQISDCKFQIENLKSEIKWEEIMEEFINIGKRIPKLDAE
jgi:hypothetical protein